MTYHINGLGDDAKKLALKTAKSMSTACASAGGTFDPNTGSCSIAADKPIFSAVGSSNALYIGGAAALIALVMYARR